MDEDGRDGHDQQECQSPGLVTAPPAEKPYQQKPEQWGDEGAREVEGRRQSGKRKVEGGKEKVEDFCQGGDGEVHRRGGVGDGTLRGIFKIVEPNRLPWGGEDALHPRHPRIAIGIYKMDLVAHKDLIPIPAPQAKAQDQ